MCNSGLIFVLFVLLLFFMIVYATIGGAGAAAKEAFVQSSKPADYCSSYGGQVNQNILLDPNRMEIYQGLTIPSKYRPTKMDTTNPMFPSVDGTENAPRSLHMMSFNRCAPECCADSPYSCDKGCVCLTNKQYEFLNTRGENRDANGCDFQSTEY